MKNIQSYIVFFILFFNFQTSTMNVYVSTAEQKNNRFDFVVAFAQQFDNRIKDNRSSDYAYSFTPEGNACYRNRRTEEHITFDEYTSYLSYIARLAIEKSSGQPLARTDSSTIADILKPIDRTLCSLDVTAASSTLNQTSPTDSIDPIDLAYLKRNAQAESQFYTELSSRKTRPRKIHYDKIRLLKKKPNNKK